MTTMIAAVMMMMRMMTIRMVSGDTSFTNYDFFYFLLLDFFLNLYMFISNVMTMTMRYVEMKDHGNHNTRNAKKNHMKHFHILCLASLNFFYVSLLLKYQSNFYFVSSSTSSNSTSISATLTASLVLLCILDIQHLIIRLINYSGRK